MLSRNLTIVSAILGAAALVATPAFAAKSTKKKAAAPKASMSQTHRSADGVYAWDGRYLGADPDPNIRFQLMRDQNQPPD
jgi:Tfp pilus assembly protein PilE